MITAEICFLVHYKPEPQLTDYHYTLSSVSPLEYITMTIALFNNLSKEVLYTTKYMINRKLKHGHFIVRNGCICRGGTAAYFCYSEMAGL